MDERMRLCDILEKKFGLEKEAEYERDKESKAVDESEWFYEFIENEALLSPDLTSIEVEKYVILTFLQTFLTSDFLSTKFFALMHQTAEIRKRLEQEILSELSSVTVLLKRLAQINSLQANEAYQKDQYRQFFGQLKNCQRSFDFFMEKSQAKDQVEIVIYFFNTLLRSSPLKNTLLQYLQNKSKEFFLRKPDKQDYSWCYKKAQEFFMYHAKLEQKLSENLEKALIKDIDKLLRKNEHLQASSLLACMLFLFPETEQKPRKIINLLRLQLKNGELSNAKIWLDLCKDNEGFKDYRLEFEQELQNRFMTLNSIGRDFSTKRREIERNNKLNKTEFEYPKVDKKSIVESLELMRESIKNNLEKIASYEEEAAKLQLSAEDNLQVANFLKMVRVIYLSIKRQFEVESLCNDFNLKLFNKLQKIVDISDESSAKFNDDFRDTTSMNSINNLIFSKLNSLFEILNTTLDKTHLSKFFLSQQAIIYSHTDKTLCRKFASVCYSLGVRLDYVGIAEGSVITKGFFNSAMIQSVATNNAYQTEEINFNNLTLSQPAFGEIKATLKGMLPNQINYNYN